MFTIAHFDADAFFVSVEQAMNPRLKGKAVAVGGLRRGIVACASYEARAKGVHTPMPTVCALRQCPELILIRGHHERYAQFSEQVFKFAEDITPYVEKTSIDEGYLDLTPCGKDAVELMRGFSARVQRELGITVSVGVGANKLVASIASKWRKPRGFTVVRRGDEAQFLAEMDVGVLPCVGPKTARHLNAEGFFKVCDIQRAGWEIFKSLFGESAHGLYEAAFGIDHRHVCFEPEPAKSVSEQETFARDVSDFSVVERHLKRMLDRMLAQLRLSGERARTITVRLRYPDWENRTLSHTLERASDLESDFYPLIAPLLHRAWRREDPVRLAGIKLSNFESGIVQTELFERQRERRRRLAVAGDALNRQYGGEHPMVVRAVHLEKKGK